MEDTGYIGDPARVHVLDGVAAALQRLERAGFWRVVVTNQSGVARGLFGEPDVVRVNAQLAAALGRAGATIDAFYYCTHLDGCDCRKPQPGLVHRAVGDLAIDLARSVVFGDRSSDMVLAQNLGIPGVLVNGVAGDSGPAPVWSAATLLAGVDWYLATAHV